MKNEAEIKILFAEDMSTDLELAVREIRRENIAFTYRCVDTEEEFRRELSEFSPDVVISDYSMPVFDGLKALQITLEQTQYTPLILLTGSRNEEIAVECMKAGARDYVLKESIQRLPFAVREAIENKKDRLLKEEAERMLKLLRRSVEHSPVSILITNKSGLIEYVNPAFCLLSRYKEKEVIGKNPRLLSSGFHPSGFYKNLWETILSGKDWTGELKNKKKDGTFYWEKVVISPVMDKNGEITHFIGIKEDITKQKKMISELIEAKEKAEESDRLKSAFLANMSHEIRTPMNGILGFLEILQNPDIPDEDRETYVDIVKKSGARMLTTINDLIEISRIEANQVELQLSRVDVNDLLDYFYNFFKLEARERGLDLTLKERLKGNSIINTDKNKLESIISNLIKNALKFTREGYVTLGCKQDLNFITFYVQDSGIGIPDDKLEQIFNRFIQAEMGYTRTHEGSGLGLAISKAYATMLGGSLTVESVKGMGATFYLRLPMGTDDQRIQPDYPVYAEQKTGHTGARILVAEDDPDSLIFLKVLLEKNNYRVIQAVNGREAVELFDSNPDLDLILMDIKMPFMTGLEATRKIREKDRDIYIIAQTAFVQSTDRQEALNAGCNDYITKPIRPDDLLGRLRVLLGGKKQNEKGN